jgi:MoaA/NifB/PqqE/SkfB family radical SAM enzyme
MFSFDGITRESYEHIRRRANFDEVLHNILKTKSRIGRRVPFGVNTTIMKRNVGEVQQTLEFWDRADFDLLRFITMVVRYNEPSLVAESLYPVRDNFNLSLDRAAEDLIKKERRIVLSAPHFNNSPLKARYPDSFHGAEVISRNPQARRVVEIRSHYQLGAGPGMTWPCRSPWTFARITPSADVELCFKFPIGNLRDQSFEDIWFGEAVMNVRKKVTSDGSICPACDHYRFCLKSETIDSDDRNSYLAQGLLASPPDFGAIVGD